MSYGEIAYEAYRKQTNGKSLISGAELRPFKDLHLEIRTAWECAAGAVANKIYSEQGA